MAKKTNTKAEEQVQEELVQATETIAETPVETAADEQPVETKQEEVVDDKNGVEAKKIDLDTTPVVPSTKDRNGNPSFKSSYNYIWNGIGY